MIFKQDYHIHTIYSGHSDKRMTIGNIIKKAEAVGLTGIAITEHAFDWHKGPKGNLALIRQELNKASTGIQVDVGLEIDPDTENPGQLHFDDFEKGEVFPVLVGFHGYPGVSRGWFEKVNFTRREKNRIYCRWLKIMHKLIENPKVDILAHPGRIIMQNGIIEEFSGKVLKDFNELAEAAAEYDVAFEMNEELLNRIPTERLQKTYIEVIRIMLNHGVKLSPGSDAHSLEKIGRFSKISRLIKSLNINNKNSLSNIQGGKNEEKVYVN